MFRSFDHLQWNTQYGKTLAQQRIVVSMPHDESIFGFCVSGIYHQAALVF
jgi:hypothetical protein